MQTLCPLHYAVYKTNLISTIVDKKEIDENYSVYKTNLISTIVDLPPLTVVHVGL